MRRQAIQVTAAVYVSLAMLAFLLGADSAQAGKRERAEKSTTSPLADDVLRYMPTQCQTFAWVNMPKLRQYDATGGELSEGVVVPEQADRIAIGWTGVPAMTIGQQHIGEDSLVAVITLKQPVPAEELRAKLIPNSAQAWREESVAGVTLCVQTSEKPLAFAMPAKQTLILGSAKLVREVLTRGKPAKLPEKLASACQRLDRSQAVALAMAAPDVLSSLVFLPAEMRKGVEAVSFYFDVNRAGNQVRLEVQCADNSIAYQFRGVLGVCRQILPFLGAQPPEAVAFLTSLDCTVKDRSLIVQAGFPRGLLGNAITPSLASGSVSGSVTTPSTTPIVVACEEVPTPAASPSPQSSTPHYNGKPTSPSPAYASSDYTTPSRPGMYETPPPVTPYAPGSTGYVPARPYTPSTSNAPALWKPLPPAAPSLYDPTPQQPAAASELAKRLGDRCAELERRLRLAEQDRDLLAQRVELYRKQVDEYRHQLDTYLEEPSRVRPTLDRSLAK